MTPDRIAKDLLDGPMWMRSMQHVLPVVRGMIERGEAALVQPSNGRARNMVALTEEGFARFAPHSARPQNIPLSTPALKARLAEAVANGGHIVEAGKSLGLSEGSTRAIWILIKRDLGEQAC